MNDDEDNTSAPGEYTTCRVKIRGVTMFDGVARGALDAARASVSRTAQPSGRRETRARLERVRSLADDWEARAADDTAVAELLALADLVAAHREEYDAHLARHLVPDALAQRRAMRQHREH